MTMEDLANLPTTGFLRLPQVLQLVPVKKTTWWNGCKTGRYPKPVKISKRTTAWRVEDIRKLIEDINSGSGKAA